ncbi:glycosyltransferase [Zobellia nedashkovskayae]|uniref:glycosyltransferase n=1 Tax=Zobellia nedashkovskayae TaxID=2779510 RepID=UPI00188AF1BF|nr:glycosyltransferase [Zobellia nedashkovskayae]
MKNLIVTYCNKYKGDFLINNWLLSLRKNVDLSNIDILVTDFGLTEEQKEELISEGVIVQSKEPKGRMSNYHYKFLREFLLENINYNQVLYSDCGDVIFQSDISHLFKLSKHQFKAAIEPEFNFILHKKTLGFQDIKSESIMEIEKILGENPTVNGGFIIGPSSKMKDIWTEYNKFCHNIDVHGTDQLIISYILYKEGFCELPKKYNYVTFLNTESFWINRQKFYENEDGIIPVVHNAGRYDFARAIDNFGYKKGKVRPKAWSYLFIYHYRLLKRIL